MRRPPPISCPASLFADFRWTFLCPRREIEPESPKMLSVQFQAPPDPPFYVVLTIPILSERYKPFLSSCTLSWNFSRLSRYWWRWNRNFAFSLSNQSRNQWKVRSWLGDITTVKILASGLVIGQHFVEFFKPFQVNLFYGLTDLFMDFLSFL